MDYIFVALQGDKLPNYGMRNDVKVLRGSEHLFPKPRDKQIHQFEF